mgnify:CR=1 FL=1
MSKVIDVRKWWPDIERTALRYVARQAESLRLERDQLKEEVEKLRNENNIRDEDRGNPRRSKK